MGTAAKLTGVDGAAAAATATAAALTWLDGAAADAGADGAAAGLAGARGPQKSLSFLFPLIQAHLIKQHRVLPKFSTSRTRDTGYPATPGCVAE